MRTLQVPTLLPSTLLLDLATTKPLWLQSLTSTRCAPQTLDARHRAASTTTTITRRLARRAAAAEVPSTSESLEVVELELEQVPVEVLSASSFAAAFGAAKDAGVVVSNRERKRSLRKRKSRPWPLLPLPSKRLLRKLKNPSSSCSPATTCTTPEWLRWCQACSQEWWCSSLVWEWACLVWEWACNSLAWEWACNSLAWAYSNPTCMVHSQEWAWECLSQAWGAWAWCQSSLHHHLSSLHHYHLVWKICLHHHKTINLTFQCQNQHQKLTSSISWTLQAGTL